MKKEKKQEAAKQVKEQVKEQEKEPENLQAKVDHVYIEEITDELRKKKVSPRDFIQETLELANNSDQEQWRMPYDAL